MNLGMTELLLIAGIALLFFGPSRLPGLGKSVGQAIRGFKKGINEDLSEDEGQEAKSKQQLTHDSSASTQKQTDREKNKQS